VEYVPSSNVSGVFALAVVTRFGIVGERSRTLQPQPHLVTPAIRPALLFINIRHYDGETESGRCLPALPTVVLRRRSRMGEDDVSRNGNHSSSGNCVNHCQSVLSKHHLNSMCTDPIQRINVSCFKGRFRRVRPHSRAFGLQRHNLPSFATTSEQPCGASSLLRHHGGSITGHMPCVPQQATPAERTPHGGRTKHPFHVMTFALSHSRISHFAICRWPSSDHI
jgi:hypothetical protein